MVLGADFASIFIDSSAVGASKRGPSPGASLQRVEIISIFGSRFSKERGFDLPVSALLMGYSNTFFQSRRAD